MRSFVTRSASFWALLVGVGFIASCNRADLDEIKENQKKIMDKLAAIEKKSGGQRPQRPPRPKVDYDKVHDISTSGLAFKGAKNAKVTIVEFTDYQ